MTMTITITTSPKLYRFQKESGVGVRSRSQESGVGVRSQESEVGVRSQGHYLQVSHSDFWYIKVKVKVLVEVSKSTYRFKVKIGI